MNKNQETCLKRSESRREEQENRSLQIVNEDFPATSNAESVRFRQVSGQVVAEYVMILTFVVAVLATTKIKFSPMGTLDISGSDPDSKTIMQTMSDSFTVWMQDILIIVSLPS